MPYSCGDEYGLTLPLDEGPYSHIFAPETRNIITSQDNLLRVYGMALELALLPIPQQDLSPGHVVSTDHNPFGSTLGLVLLPLGVEEDVDGIRHIAM